MIHLQANLFFSYRLLIMYVFFFQVMDIYPHELSIPFDETMCEEIPNTILMVDDNSQNTSDGESIDIEIDV